MVVISHADPKEYIGLVVCWSVVDSDFMHFSLDPSVDPLLMKMFNYTSSFIKLKRQNP